MKTNIKESKKINYLFGNLPDPLSLDEESKLIRRYNENKDFQARNLLIEANLPYAIGVLNDIARQRPEHYYEGLSETMIDACLYAAETIEDRGIKFISYLHSFLPGKLFNFKPDTDSKGRELINRLDHGNYRPGHLLNNTLRKFFGEDYIQGNKKISHLLNNGNRHYSKSRLIPFRLNHNSLESESWPNEDGWVPRNLEEYAIDHSALPPDEIFDIEERNRLIETSLKSLDGRSEHVLRLYFLEGKTLTDVGEEIGITMERVRQIKERGLNKLRHLTYHDVFSDYI